MSHRDSYNVRALLAACGLVLGAQGLARAQAQFAESFEDNGLVSPGQYGPANLIARGWTFRTQSSPPSSYGSTFFDGYLSWLNPQAGVGYLAVSYYPDPIGGGPVSQWATLPPIAGQTAGDALTFWLQGMGPVPTQHFQVRYSPSGGMSTGSGPTGIGDFTQVLADISPAPSGGWQRFVLPLPGPGRIALRLVDQFVFGDGSPYIGIDTLSVGPPPPPPCNQPPVPGAGQSVTWTLANSPYRVCTDLLIPPGGTVAIEPGVVIDIDAGHTLALAGTVNGTGTAGSHIVFAGATNFPPALTLAGNVSLRYADFHGQVRPRSAADIRLTDCTFPADGLLYTDGGSPGGAWTPAYLRLERCTFTSSTCTLSDCLVSMNSCAFSDTLVWLLRGYADTTGGVSVSGQPLVIMREEHAQPLLVDNVSAAGVFTPITTVSGPSGLSLQGGDYLLGPGNSLQGSAYTLDLVGGLLPGSTVPAAGNGTDRVFVRGAGGAARWANTGVPYLVNGLVGDGARLVIDPGVHVEGAPDGSLVTVGTGSFRFRGTPEAPISFSGQGGQTWGGISGQSGHDNTTLEYCAISNAAAGAGASDAALYVENCTLQNNVVGVGASSYGGVFVRKSILSGNGTAVTTTPLGAADLNSTSNPVSIAGNTAGSSCAGPSDLRNVWWGSPTGPQNPQNPGGTGDIVNGGTFLPFLTSPPDFADHPPVVRMQAPGQGFWRVAVTPDFVFEPGQKYFVTWDASDDGAIASQRILVSINGAPGTYQVVADNIPPGARSWEITIPSLGFSQVYGYQFIRVQATDNAGQDGWDETACTIIAGMVNASVIITPGIAGQTFTAGMVPPPPVAYTGSTGLYSVFSQLYLEGDGAYAAGSLGLLPFVSTDLARKVVYVVNNSNDVRFFLGGEYFSIRPDPRLGLGAPQVALQSPAPAFAPGATVPLAWTAAAAQGLYSFDIQASLDGGQYWRLVASELPAAARSYDWVLPANASLNPDVRVRVIAHDRRFQNSSSSGAFAIGTACYANCDGSTIAPAVNVQDFACFLNRFAAGDSYANCDGSTAPPILNVLDFTCFLNAFAAGCS